MIDFTEREDSILFPVRVVPRASKSEIAGEFDGALKIRIASPPVDGAANSELIKILSKHFKIAKSQVEITGGQTSKLKQIKLTNLHVKEFVKLLNLK